MSSRTPKECVELAVDTSADSGDRENAIHELEMANERDELAKIVLNGDIEESYRQQALRVIGTLQRDATLERLVEEESLESSFQETAEELLQAMEDD